MRHLHLAFLKMTYISMLTVFARISQCCTRIVFPREGGGGYLAYEEAEMVVGNFELNP